MQKITKSGVSIKHVNAELKEVIQYKKGICEADFSSNGKSGAAIKFPREPSDSGFLSNLLLIQPA